MKLQHILKTLNLNNENTTIGLVILRHLGNLGEIKM